LFIPATDPSTVTVTVNKDSGKHKQICLMLIVEVRTHKLC